jgi:hypothetical protein
VSLRSVNHSKIRNCLNLLLAFNSVQYNIIMLVSWMCYHYLVARNQRWKVNVVLCVVRWIFWAGVLSWSPENDPSKCTVNCATLRLLYVGRSGQTSENRLLWLWTKASMTLDWGSSALDITRAGIVGISYCLYGFVYCTVLVLAVLTDGRWKLAATYCNTIRCHHCGIML